MNIEPDKIYLMAEVRKGMDILKKRICKFGISKKKTVGLSEISFEFKGLSASEVHHFASYKKRELNDIEERKQ